MNIPTVLCALIVLAACADHAEAQVKGKPSGERGFEKYCASCHPDGANTINQAKPLDRDSLKKNGITTWQSVVAFMRQPGPGMTAFDKKTIPDKEARAIAEYVLKTFK